MLPNKGDKITARNTEIGICFTGTVRQISYDAGPDNRDGWVEIDVPDVNMLAKLGRETWDFCLVNEGD